MTTYGLCVLDLGEDRKVAKRREEGMDGGRYVPGSTSCPQDTMRRILLMG